MRVLNRCGGPARDLALPLSLRLAMRTCLRLLMLMSMRACESTCRGSWIRTGWWLLMVLGPWLSVMPLVMLIGSRESNASWSAVCGPGAAASG